MAGKKPSEQESGNVERGRTPATPMDMLKQDHERVSGLFRDCESSTGTRKRSIADTIMRELEIHSSIEEEIFYPALKEKAGSDGKDKVEEGVKEHGDVKRLIATLRSTEQEAAFTKGLADLKQKVQHHVQEEENEMFPLAQQVLADLNSLAESMRARKQELAQQAPVGSTRA